LATPAAAQELAFAVPDGPRHTIVMVDASRTMAGTVKGDPEAKRRALRRAERYLASLLYDGKNPLYRPGRDYLSLVDYGFDSLPDANRAFRRLKGAELRDDYVRVRLAARSDVDRREFLQKVRPPVRRNLNILGWAFPMCLEAVAVPDAKVQTTTVLMLNDALTNDGSVVLERFNLGNHLGPQGKANLKTAEDKVWGAVQVGDAVGAARPLWQRTFPARTEQIVVTALRALPTTTLTEVERFRGVDPLKQAELRWVGGGLELVTEIPRSLVGREATANVAVGKGFLSSGRTRLTERTRFLLRGNPRPAGHQSGRLKLSVAASAKNPVLGRQGFTIDFVRATLVPPHPSYTGVARFLTFLLWTLPMLLAALGFWLLYERLVARRVKIGFAEFPSPFPLPNPSANTEQAYRTRVSAPPGGRIATVHLPPRWVRRLTNPNAVVRWDDRLQVAGIEGPSAPLQDLPRQFDLLWAQHPGAAGEFRVEIERPDFGGSQRAAAIVSYPSWQPHPMSQTEAIAHPHRDIVVSLDLGSESTAAFVQLPGEREPRALRLQHYLPALSNDADVLQASRSKPSHRLRTRFFANENLSSPVPFRRREWPTHYEILPENHPRLPLVDFGAFNRDTTTGEKIAYSQNSGECFFRFIASRTSPYEHRLLLPNAKLVFQTGADFSRRHTFEFAGERHDEMVHPVELIYNQVCLVLENFVRQEPSVLAKAPEPGWHRFAVVLTVPNNYSPFHRDVLKKLVSQRLTGAEVQIITESDAIVYYYIAENKPNLGMEKSTAFIGAKELYLTLDVGKGTTDLSLVVLDYESDGRVIRQRVTNAASNGRASGGAKMTFYVARFFESLMDLEFQRFLTEFPEATAHERMPYRLTVLSDKPLTQDTNLTRCLLAFERHCEAFKHGLTMKDAALQAGTTGPSEDASAVAVYLAGELGNYLRNEEQLRVSHVQQTALEERLVAALTAPREIAGSDAAWARLTKQVESYVTVNVDTVLAELINAYLKPNSSRTLDALTGLKALAKGSGRCRTHIIVSGQGSRFAPLRTRLDELATNAGLPVVDEATFRDWTKGKVPEFAKSPFWHFGSAKQNRPQYRNVMVRLDDANLKDGCSLGALHWYLEHPESTNPNAVGGQLVVRAQNGANPRPVPMDALNDGKRIELTEDFLNQETAWEVYYLPCRGLDMRNADEVGLNPVLRLRRTSKIAFWNENGSVVIEVDGVRQSLESAIYDAENNERLRAMVWPNVLLDGEPEDR
jgi:hypothetical protein